MRPLEILLSLANLLSFFILMIRLPSTPWMRYSVLLALLITGAFTTDKHQDSPLEEANRRLIHGRYRQDSLHFA